jgi:hypothetical protein
VSVSSDYDELNLQNNINASNYIKPSESNLTTEQQRIAQKLLSNKASLNYIWNKTLNHLKQRIFRVRKSRIIVSFDDIQQQKDGRVYFPILNHWFFHLDDKNNFNTLVNTVVRDMSTEINHVRSQLTIDHEQQTEVCLIKFIFLIKIYFSFRLQIIQLYLFFNHLIQLFEKVNYS